ncbi:MAG: hypothetical protein LBC85_03955 [Fibromonadaceae bacterium]|jgi:hypothetical protein|nr:hypothetical protein [Fibromonadaceae bacterium]
MKTTTLGKNEETLAFGVFKNANSKHFNALGKQQTHAFSEKSDKKVLKLQENEDWVAIGDFFFYINPP